VENPRFAEFMNDKDLSTINLRELSASERDITICLQRKTFDSLPNQASTHQLHMNF